MEDNKLISNLNQIAENNIPASTNIWLEVKGRLNSSSSKQRTKPKRRVWSSAVIGLVVIILAFFTIPPVRAYLEDVFKTIGEVVYTLTGDYPGLGQIARTIKSEDFPLEQVQNEFPFVYPEWSPTSHELESKVHTTWWPDDSQVRPDIELTWIGPKGQGHIFLGVTQFPGEIIGPINIETLNIKGQEVAYWTGGWNYDTKEWDENAGGQVLSWSMDDLGYRLSAYGSVPLDDLIQMVESMLP